MIIPEGKFKAIMPLNVKAINVQVAYQEADDSYTVWRSPVLGIAVTQEHEDAGDDDLGTCLNLKYLVHDGEYGADVICHGNNTVSEVFFLETDTEEDIAAGIEEMKPRAKAHLARSRELERWRAKRAE